MKKDLLINGIDNMDDELITEAEEASGLSYKAKIRIIRTIVVGAAAAAMITTGVFLHSRNMNRLNEVTDGETAVQSVSEPSDEMSGVVAGTESASEAASTVTNVTTTASVTKTAVLAVTTASPAEKEKVTTVTGVWDDEDEIQPQTVIVNADTNEVIDAGDSPVETDTAPSVYDPEPYFPPTPLPEHSIFDAVSGYHNDKHPDVVSVQFGNAFIKGKYNLWLNCTKEQSDMWLECIDNMQLTEEVMEVIITGGGYIVRVNYSDGTSEEYELWGDYGQLFYTDRNGNRSTLRDTSGTYTSFFDSVYNTYLADVGEVDAYTKANFNY